MELTEFETIYLLIMRRYGDKKRSYLRGNKFYLMIDSKTDHWYQKLEFTIVHRFEESGSIKNHGGCARLESVTNDIPEFL